MLYTISLGLSGLSVQFPQFRKSTRLPALHHALKSLSGNSRTHLISLLLPRDYCFSFPHVQCLAKFNLWIFYCFLWKSTSGPRYSILVRYRSHFLKKVCTIIKLSQIISYGSCNIHILFQSYFQHQNLFIVIVFDYKILESVDTTLGPLLLKPFNYIWLINLKFYEGHRDMINIYNMQLYFILYEV